MQDGNPAMLSTCSKIKLSSMMYCFYSKKMKSCAITVMLKGTNRINLIQQQSNSPDWLLAFDDFVAPDVAVHLESHVKISPKI